MKIKNSKNKLLLTLTATAVTALVAWGMYAYLSTPSQPSSVSSSNTTNLEPATNSDKGLNDRNKQDLANSNQPEVANDTQGAEKKNVEVVISAWGQPDGPSSDFKLNGYAIGIIESNGNCTLTMTKGDETVATTKGALQNAQDTSCGQLSIPYSELFPGKWQATLSYSSTESSGSSKIVTVEVK